MKRIISLSFFVFFLAISIFSLSPSKPTLVSPALAACTPGFETCGGSKIRGWQKCNSAGTAYVQNSCGEGTHCGGEPDNLGRISCYVDVVPAGTKCTPKTRRCAVGVVNLQEFYQTCQDNGTWGPNQKCETPGTYCDPTTTLAICNPPANPPPGSTTPIQCPICNGGDMLTTDPTKCRPKVDSIAKGLYTAPTIPCPDLGGLSCNGPGTQGGCVGADGLPVDKTTAATNPPFCAPSLSGGNIIYTCHTAIGDVVASPQGFIARIFGLILSISGGIALLLIIISGYKILASQGNPEALKGAREQLTAAIVGLLFIIFALVILQIIGYDILRIPAFKP